MGPMLRELYEEPNLGFLYTEYFMRWRGVTLVQYWRSFNSLESYSQGMPLEGEAKLQAVT
ncbi:hypothetical protein GCM10025859_18110 [Alicyclobacillus fastidiosus]|nr:hypothetical protein GCM10025859_18110 [Alicyclobacillus fastidiosus]